MLPIKLRIVLIILSLILIVIISRNIKKERIPIKYSLIWYISALLVLFVGIFPNALDAITSLIGFETTSNLIIGIILGLILLILLVLTIIVSNQKKQITLLIQEISILKKDK